MAKSSTEPPKKNGGTTDSENLMGPKRAYLHPETVKRGKTEKGYSHRLASEVLGLESQIRTNKDESMTVFNENGDRVFFMQGKGAKVNGTPADLAKIPKDGIITHNHPRALGKKGIAAIGNSFSWEDLNTAVRVDAAEIRAVTPTFTFSMKRPKGGWGVSQAQLKAAYKEEIGKVYKRANEYIFKAKDINDLNRRTARFTATGIHDVAEALAKRFGWDYTKKKG